MSCKFETVRVRSRRRVMAETILQTQRFVTVPEVARLLRSMGYPESRGAARSVIDCLREEYGWVTWRPAPHVVAYHPPEVTEDEERAMRLQMGFVNPRGKRWKKGDPGCTGWQELVEYIHRAAKECGVVRGFAWEYFNEPF